MKPFKYHEPKNIKEACRLLNAHGDRARIIAGGTDLVIKMKRGIESPEHVIDIKKIETLNGITETADGFIIGAATSLAAVANHNGLKAKLPILSEAALSVGSAQVRNLATIGGNICNAAPSADMAPGLLILESNVTIADINKEKVIPLASFFTGPGEVLLKEGELVKDIFVPFPAKDFHMIYLKHGPRRTMDCAVVGIAMGLLIERDTKVCHEARIALGAVAPTPVRATKTEKIMIGKTIPEFDFENIKATACKEAEPISDVRASADY